VGKIYSNQLPVGSYKTDMPAKFAKDAYFIPNSDKILFKVWYTEARNTEYYFGIAETDGKNPRTLNGAAGSNVGKPIFSPNGDKFIYGTSSSGGGCQYEIDFFVFDLNTEINYKHPQLDYSHYKNADEGFGSHTRIHDVSWVDNGFILFTDTPKMCLSDYSEKDLPQSTYVWKLESNQILKQTQVE
jgi:hypothetical protein